MLEQFFPGSGITVHKYNNVTIGEAMLSVSRKIWGTFCIPFRNVKLCLSNHNSCLSSSSSPICYSFASPTAPETFPPMKLFTVETSLELTQLHAETSI